MNVKGFSSDGTVSELRVATLNESIMALSQRFSQAMLKFPSEETENELIQITKEFDEKETTNAVHFQCLREISKSKIQRGDFKNAIPFLIQSLKIDENRTDIWSQLALCASRVQNISLFRAANSKIRKLRPQYSITVSTPQLPTLNIPQQVPTFCGFYVPQGCYRYFFKILVIANKTNPYDIPEFLFATSQLFLESQTTHLYRPDNIRHMTVVQQNNQHPIQKLASITLFDFLTHLGFQQFEHSAWLSPSPVRMLTINVINKVSTLPFTEQFPKDLATSLFELSSFVLDDLSQFSYLFLAELSSKFKPEICKQFLSRLSPPGIQLPNALLQISFTQLEQEIRENAPYAKLEKLLNACKNHLTEPLCIAHADRVIDMGLLNEKENQIKILKMISLCEKPEEDKSADLLSDAIIVRLFSEQQDLQFLSLNNIITLFLHLPDNEQQEVFPSFLDFLPDLVKKSPQEIERLDKVFSKVPDKLSESSFNSLYSLFKVITDMNNQIHKPQLLFSIGLAIARASGNSPEHITQLVRVHKALGKFGVCSEQNGAFLEILLDALLSTNGDPQYESDTISAFNCYFSDFTISQSNHRSKSKFKCSRFIQPYLEYLMHLEDKDGIQQGLLFSPYLGIWKHWQHSHQLQKELSKQNDLEEDQRTLEKPCNCIQDFDGWRFYKVIKKKENLLNKCELPPGYTPQMVLEDILRHGSANNPESRILLAKVLIKNAISSATPSFSSTERGPLPEQPTQSLNEAISLLEGEDSQNLKLMYALALALLSTPESSQKSLDILQSIETFTKPKKEARKLYWIIRLSKELSQDNKITDEKIKARCRQALDLAKSLPNDFSVSLVSEAAEALGMENILKEQIDKTIKSKILSPLPFVSLSRLQKETHPDLAFNTITKITRNNSSNIFNFFHFDFHPPFLMARPDDINMIRAEILNIFIYTASKSGNYKSLVCLFNPSRKFDKKASKVLKTNRFIFGIDRIDIFEIYVEELTKIIETGDKFNKDPLLKEMGIDALVKGTQIEISEQFNEKLEHLFAVMWKKQTGQDSTEESSINDLINLINGREPNEEEDEEEDGEFVDNSESDDVEEDDVEDDEKDDEEPEAKFEDDEDDE